MTIGEWLTHAERTLEAENGTPRLDAEVLLSDALKKDKAWLLAYPDSEIRPLTLGKLMMQLKRRERHEPLAYIRGKVEFYGREFMVNKRVLVPRPESETMIDLLKKHVRNIPAIPLDLADVGSGSGALGITAAIEIKARRVHFYDIDPDTLAIANANARKHKIRGQYYPSDLLEPNWGPYDIILANLPYVPDSHTVNAAANHEPKLAIFGGPDGLDVYRKLFIQIKTLNWKPQLVFTESLPFQHEELAAMASEAGFKQIDEEDFIQAFERK